MGLVIALSALLPATASAQYDRRDRREIQRDRERVRRSVQELRRDQRGLRGGQWSDSRYNRRDDRWRDNRWNDNRQSKKNEWRNLGIAGGAVGVYGLLSGNRTLAALGLGGGLYSAYRYEQDRKSQNRFDRDRYDLFRRPSFEYQGHRYDRRERFRDGQRYYYFSRVR